MEDKQIIDMLWNREEEGLKALQEQYCVRLTALAGNYVSAEDAQECMNDVLLAVWDSIPPNRPDNLFAYSAKICRNKALNMLRRGACRKRRAQVVELTMELQNVIPDKVEEENILADLINAFLEQERAQDRYLFVHRYWFGESIRELSGQTGYSESRVKSRLFRMRKRLRKYLEGRYRI